VSVLSPLSPYPLQTDINPRQGKTVAMVLDQPFPPDARVEREAVALTEAGYQVHLLCMFSQNPDRQKAEPATEVYRGFTLHRVDPQAITWQIPGTPFQTRLPYKGLLKSINRLLFNVDSAWQTAIDRFCTTVQPDMLHIHDLRLVSTGLRIAQKRQIPLVADLHENYPALMRILKGKIDPEIGLKARKKWQTIENRCVKKASHVLVVVEEAKERLVNNGLAPDKVTVVANTVDAQKFLALPEDPQDTLVKKQARGHFVLTYVGFINSDHRGIHTVIDALALLKNECPNLLFIAAGGYREPYKRVLDEKILSHGLESSVWFTGWLDESDFVPYIQAADIGLCPHQANEHTHHTFPNKVYLYHLFQKPVIVSDCRPLERYINDTEGGLVFPSENAEALADTIIQLYHNATLRRQLGENGHQQVIKTYNWQHTAQALVNTYDSVLGLVTTEKAL